MQQALEPDFKVEGIHKFENEVDAVKKSEALFIGGGNTFLLLKMLYEKHLVSSCSCIDKLTQISLTLKYFQVEPIRARVLEQKMPYMGSSAGTNVATVNLFETICFRQYSNYEFQFQVSINTTNDMPICYPPTFFALQLVNFNINPHYLDPEEGSKHKGETREDRIREYHHLNDRYVLGLREGSCLLIDGDKASLLGINGARLFKRNEEPVEYQTNADLSFLLN